mgnify:CR=1 FL=1
MKKSFQITIPESDKYFCSTEIQISSQTAPNVLNTKEYELLTFYKNKIDEKEYNKCWDNYKKYSNEYELVHTSCIKNKINNSIAYYIPLSRSYYKLWEIISDYGLLYYQYNITTAHIAEGPGGFMEAVVNYRKKMGKYNEKVYGITLSSTEKEIPGWRKSEKFLKYNPNIKILYGEDNTGNIYKLPNILDFRKKVGSESCELVTADGGFDFSVDFNKQEQMSYQLIFCEIVSALSVQKTGGSFVCKFFDTYSLLTVKFLWLLNVCYESLIFTKPLTSRSANSEKYIVAYKFRGLDEFYLQQLFLIVDQWNCLEENTYVTDIFNFSIPKDYLQIINNYNNYMILSQTYNIIKTLHLIKCNLSEKDKYSLVRRQVEKAIKWCLKYQIEVNYKSCYLLPQDRSYINQYLKKYYSNY